MAEVITTAPKSKEAEVKLLIMPLGELTLHLGDDKASTAIEAIANFVNRRSPVKELHASNSEDSAPDETGPVPIDAHGGHAHGIRILP